MICPCSVFFSELGIFVRARQVFGAFLATLHFTPGYADGFPQISMLLKEQRVRRHADGDEVVQARKPV